jgi:hypothetical protein
MLIGSIYGWESGCDDLFDPNSPRNRDNCLEPFRIMREYALNKGIELHTADIVTKTNIHPDFSLHIESDLVNIGSASPEYLIRFETPLTVPLNENANFLRHFKCIFTWDLDLLEGRGSNDAYQLIAKNCLVEVRTPNPLPNAIKLEQLSPSYADRNIFCCLIASNRHANLPDRRELYSERAKVIRWFEKNTPENFRLYGNGWSVPEKRLGSIGRLRYRLEKVIPFLTRRPVFPSYQGPVNTKQSVLLDSKFCICFENARDIRGYFTEKIFDCLFAGCVPIYWGEPDIARWIPQECFISFRAFNSFESLYKYLSSITPEIYMQMQNAGQKFIRSKAFDAHTSEAFSKVIIDRIATDFGLS